MVLSEFERESGVWKKIEAELMTRIESYRCRNDQDLSPLETARLRGTIAAMKEILAWGHEPPKLTD